MGKVNFAILILAIFGSATAVAAEDIVGVGLFGVEVPNHSGCTRIDPARIFLAIVEAESSADADARQLCHPERFTRTSRYSLSKTSIKNGTVCSFMAVATYLCIP